MSDNHESHTQDSTEPGSSTFVAQNAANSPGGANPAPSATNNSFYNSIVESIDTPSSPLSQAIDADILQELENILAAATTHPVADDQPTDDSTATQDSQMGDVDGATIPPGLQEAVTTSTADNSGHNSISINQSAALAWAAALNANVMANYGLKNGHPIAPSPLITLPEALGSYLVPVWPIGGTQFWYRDTGRFRRTPSREEVATFIEGLEKIDVERLESNDRGCGICRGPYGDPVSMNNCMPEYPIKLPCGYVFGIECLTLLLSPRPEGWGDSLCPLCRVRIEVPETAARGEPLATASLENEDDMPLLIDQ